MDERANLWMGLVPSPPSWVQRLNLPSYVKRQGEACAYMASRLKLMHWLPARARDELLEVHRRQAASLALFAKFGGGVRPSFYFDAMYGRSEVEQWRSGIVGLDILNLDPNEQAQDDMILVTLCHVAGYLRGAERYDQICRYDAHDLSWLGNDRRAALAGMWEGFMHDAEHNAEVLGRAVLEVWPNVKRAHVVKAWRNVVERERKVMFLIWLHGDREMDRRKLSWRRDLDMWRERDGRKSLCPEWSRPKHGRIFKIGDDYDVVYKWIPEERKRSPIQTDFPSLDAAICTADYHKGVEPGLGGVRI